MSDWWHNAENVLEFARVMHETGEFATIDDVLYFFEKPYKWTVERERWLAMGKPEPMTEAQLESMLS